MNDELDVAEMNRRFTDWAGRIMAAEYAHKRAKGNDQDVSLGAAVCAMQKLGELLGVQVKEDE